MLQNIILILQIILSVLLIIFIMLQAPEGGLSPAFGGGGEMYRSRRNVEKFLLYATIVTSSLLVLLSLAQLFIHGK
jgi:preprotein translocase subunit SecG